MQAVPLRYGMCVLDRGGTSGGKTGIRRWVAAGTVEVSPEPHRRPYGAPSVSPMVAPGETDPDAILCPAQTGATDCCATCALCWQSLRSIAFRPH